MGSPYDSVATSKKILVPFLPIWDWILLISYFITSLSTTHDLFLSSFLSHFEIMKSLTKAVMQTLNSTLKIYPKILIKKKTWLGARSVANKRVCLTA